MASVQKGKLEAFNCGRFFGFAAVSAYGSVFVHGDDFQKVEKIDERFVFSDYPDKASRNKAVQNLRRSNDVVLLDIKSKDRGFRATKWGLFPT